MMMSMTLGTWEKASAEINVTPLIDVLLVLLIIFMLVVPHQRRGETAEIPRQNRPTETSARPDPIIIQLLGAGQGESPELRINQDSVAWNALDSRLNEIFQLRADKVMFLKSDPEIDFQHVANALDIAHHAGVDRIALMDPDSLSVKSASIDRQRN
jgi:biopolymer transport protein TolR